jgi:succinate-acetate transporter protein
MPELDGLIPSLGGILLSVSEDRTVQATSTPLSGIADPAPLGLAGFATTTFLLSADNAGWMNAASGAAFLGYAFAYGGFAQLLAGMWEFRNRNVFGATAFSTYGGFWMGLGIVVVLADVSKTFAASLTAANITNALAWFLFSFAIFNTYMLIGSMRVNMAVFMVFLTLEITEILLVIGFFRLSHDPTATWVLHAGGWVGVVTAAVAWYTSAAGVWNGVAGRTLLPVGGPLVSQSRATAMA